MGVLFDPASPSNPGVGGRRAWESKSSARVGELVRIGEEGRLGQEGRVGQGERGCRRWTWRGSKERLKEREKEVSIERPTPQSTQPLAKIGSVLRVAQDFVVACFLGTCSRRSLCLEIWSCICSICLSHTSRGTPS